MLTMKKLETVAIFNCQQDICVYIHQNNFRNVVLAAVEPQSARNITKEEVADNTEFIQHDQDG